MRKLTIYRQYFTKSDCYNAGVIQTPKGIQVHSTGAVNSYLKRYVGPDDGRLGKNQYNNTHNRPGGNVCANAYIGKLDNGTVAVYQALPWDMRCWLSGSGDKGNANKLGYIGFEICEDNLQNKAYFEEAVMTQSVNLVAYLCNKYNIPLSNVLDHVELHKAGIGSNHGDIKEWLSKFGLNMNHYRAAVKQAMAEGVSVTYVTGNATTSETPVQKEENKKVMYNAKVVARVGNTVNVRQSTTTASKSLTKIPVGNTVEVLEDLGEWCQIRYNGLVGYMKAEFLEKIQNSTTTTPAPATPTIAADETIVKKKELEEIRDKLTEVLNKINTILKT